MSDQFDVEVHDAEALEEIELLANLIVATSEHTGRVPQDRIDEILGVTPGAGVPPEPGGAPASPVDHAVEETGSADGP